MVEKEREAHVSLVISFTCTGGLWIDSFYLILDKVVRKADCWCPGIS